MTYQSLEQIEDVVRDFESCTIAANNFMHAHHLTVAVWYLREAPFAAALKKFRENLFEFIAHHGVNPRKYSETITQFWFKLAAHNMKQLAQDVSPVEQINHVIARLGNSRLILDYYSEERLRSPRAAQSWIEPDLKPMPE